MRAITLTISGKGKEGDRSEIDGLNKLGYVCVKLR